MNELYKIHSFYMFSLRSYIYVIKRAILKVQTKWDEQNKTQQDEGEEQNEGEGEAEVKETKELSDEDLEKRIDLLVESITETSWD